MRALITGAAGFVGGYLADELGRRGYEVAATKLPFEQFAPGRAFSPALDMDILDERAVRGALLSARPDAVFHLAAQSSSAVAWKNPQLTIDVNVKGSVNLLEALRKLDYRPRTVLVGSCEEYGAQDESAMPIGEDAPTRPDNVYAVTRRAQNSFGALYARAYGLDVIMTRSFNHVGAGHADTFAIPSFCRQIAEIAAGRREPVLSVGNLSARRDYIDVRDVCRAYADLAEKGASGETYNIGSGRAVSLREIVGMIAGFSGRSVEIRVDPEKLRPLDAPIIEADIGKITALTGWKPAIPLEQALREVYDYYVAKVAAD